MEVIVEELGGNDGVRDGLVEAFVGVADDEERGESFNVI